MRRTLLAALFSALACATGAPPPDAEHAALWGYVTLVPKDGAASAGDAYADRRLRDVARFDYAHPTFAVVYLANGAAPAPASHRLTLAESARGLRWEPAQLVVAAADELVIANGSPHPQIVSAPEAEWLRNLAPGESAVLHPPAGGELEIHRLGADAAPALVWIAPGAYATADAAGHYQLRGLTPGVAQVRAWHPRLPPSATREVALRAGESVRLDLEIGVDRRERSGP
jgi:hypothetical protein